MYVMSAHHTIAFHPQISFVTEKKKCRERTYVTVDGVEIIDA